ncbi:carboxylesterase [Hahella sp. KA22]|uniref:alpha/beta hydrolase n=1 Tax=Hahella sp. KA22 TaxID=1628392 RepID=UPI000FDD36C1|nr:carboxylesterase [Hahella sp. KA22]AZZ93822.1 carboxylesterase [Hahella sp. KA22]QAY57195.1 carboxylesterase [Hahella sp. KA22]
MTILAPTQTLLPHIEIEPTKPADATFIMLHGLGADGNDFAPIVLELRLPEDMAVRFIFPHAPSIPVTINGGYVMPAWYDILEMNIERKVDEAHLQASANAVRALVDREIERGIDSRRIIVAGFSQGGAVAYQTALTYPKPLAGLMGLSTYLATVASLKPDPANRDIPIRICHGTVDSVVPESLGRAALGHLQTMGYAPEYSTYPMDHSVCLEEIHDISAWIQKVLA